MRGTSSGIKMLVAFGSAVLLAGTVAPAVATATVTDPTAESAAGSGSTQIVNTTPLAPATAAARADAAYDESAASTGAAVRIVTVEQSADGPTIVSHPVTSDTQAQAVAKDAARGNDLVAVQSDHVIRAVGASTNDSYAPTQWNLDKTKTTFTSSWAVTKGAGITVAVIDTGVAADHPDLKGQVLAGQAFINGKPKGATMNPAYDDCGHGTHVAGTIAALANNGVGIAGAAPAVKILPVKVLKLIPNVGCSGNSSDVANGIKWAANKGARVINLSLGGPGADSALALAVDYARKKGAVVVAAAGNNGVCTVNKVNVGTNAISYPGATAGVIGVAAVDKNLAHPCFSNSGKYVDIAAPGVDVLSTYPPKLSGKGAPYWYMSGTSMATPHVAAAAALVLAKRPSCTPDRVESRLESTAKRLGTGVPNNNYGFGLVDPAKAVSAAC